MADKRFDWSGFAKSEEEFRRRMGSSRDLEYVFILAGGTKFTPFIDGYGYGARVYRETARGWKEVLGSPVHICDYGQADSCSSYEKFKILVESVLRPIAFRDKKKSIRHMVFLTNDFGESLVGELPKKAKALFDKRFECVPGTLVENFVAAIEDDYGIAVRQYWSSSHNLSYDEAKSWAESAMAVFREKYPDIPARLSIPPKKDYDSSPDFNIDLTVFVSSDVPLDVFEGIQKFLDKKG